MVIAQKALVNLKRFPKKYLRFAVFPLILKDCGQVVVASGGIGMVIAQKTLVNLKRLSEKFSGFRIFSFFVKIFPLRHIPFSLGKLFLGFLRQAGNIRQDLHMAFGIGGFPMIRALLFFAQGQDFPGRLEGLGELSGF
ncbi:MAG: hypothetical protein HY717_08965 [Planctomycetes bacterium]|nr:hypothetical protein [Planctomycetota bacterium]